MILADVRHDLTRDDAQLALALMGECGTRAGAEAEARFRRHGLDAVLDDERLLAALLEHPRGAHASLRLLCYVLVRHALLQGGERDRRLAGFVAAIVLHFGVRDRARRLAEHDDEVYDTLAALGAAVDQPDPRRAFLVRTHLGEYALWLSGMYPDWIAHRRHRRGGPSLGYYEAMGRRGFQLAAEHRLAAEHGLSPLLAQAAERFAVLRVALNRLSDTLLFPRHHSPDRLLRQVSDEARWHQR